MFTKLTGKMVFGTVLLLAALLLGSLPLFAANPLAPFELNIDNVTNVRIGDKLPVNIFYASGTESFAGFKLVVSFDATRLKFIEAVSAGPAVGCGWEFFSYNLVPCPGCDTQVVEIFATADLANGAAHPTCLSSPGALAKLNFKVTTDTTKANSRAPINFYWNDCTSNTLNSASQDTTWHGKFVFDYQGNNITGIDPHLGGTLAGCVSPGPVVPIRGTNYSDGGITIRADFGKYGDVNGDGKFNLSDITFLINYIFASGPVPRDYLHGDLDGDEQVSISDAVLLLHFLFGSTPE